MMGERASMYLASSYLSASSWARDEDSFAEGIWARSSLAFVSTVSTASAPAAKRGDGSS